MKSLLLLPLLMLGILFTSCKKEEIIRQEVVIPNRTIQFEIPTDQWVLDNQTNTFFVEIDIDEIDDYTNQNSGILVYISRDQTSYQAIPYVIDAYSFYYSYAPGKLFLEVQNADGTRVAPPGNTIYAKVVLVESDPIP